MPRTRAATATIVDRLTFSDALFAGAAAGVVGGALMAIWSAILAALTGYGFLFPFKAVGAAFVGVHALVGGGGTVLYGLGLHFLIAAAFGALFGALSRPISSAGGALAAGIAYGLGILLLMTFVVLPATNATLFERVVLVPGSWFLLHVLYGAGVSLAPVIGTYVSRSNLFSARSQRPSR